MRKKIVFVVLGLVIIGAAGYIMIDYFQTSTYSEIKEAAEKYVACFDEKIESFGPSSEMNDGSVMAIVALIKGKDKEYVGCIYFENDEIWRHRYTPAGIISIDKGKVGASTEMVNYSYCNFIFGMEIEKENRKVSIPGMQLEELYAGKDYLKISYPGIGLQKVYQHE